MRLFVASTLPSADCDAYERFVHDISDRTAGAIRPVPSGSAHFTHAFLGDVPDGLIEQVRQVVADAADREAARTVEPGAPKVLDGRSGPRAIIVPMVTGAAELFEMEKALVLALRAIPSLATAPMPKPPHVTIARFRRSATRRDGEWVSELLARKAPIPRPFPVDRIQVMSSTLTPAGAVYEEVASAPLRPELS